MEKKTGQEILKRLVEYFSTDNNPYDDNTYAGGFIHKWYDENLLGLGTIEEVYRKICTESDKVVIVNHFVDHDVYIKTKGKASRSCLYFHKGFGKVVNKIEKRTIVYKINKQSKLE